MRPGALTSAVRRQLSRGEDLPAGIDDIDALVGAGWSEAAIGLALGLGPTSVARWRAAEVPPAWLPRLGELLLRGPPRSRRTSSG
ncbi:MAG: hypothetical protein ACRDWN_01845 [Acidimicrobiales bacterium]